MYQLNTRMLSALDSLLHWKHPNIASCLPHHPTEPLYSTTGWFTAMASVMTLSCLISPLPSNSTSSLSLASDTNGVSYPVAQSPSNLSMWQRPYAPLARSLHDWGKQILKWTDNDTITASVLSIKPGMTRIQPPHEFGPSTSPSSDPWPNDSNTILSLTEPMLSSTSASLDSFSYAAQASMPSPPPLSKDRAHLSDCMTSPSAVPLSNVVAPPLFLE